MWHHQLAGTEHEPGCVSGLKPEPEPELGHSLKPEPGGHSLPGRSLKPEPGTDPGTDPGHGLESGHGAGHRHGLEPHRLHRSTYPEPALATPAMSMELHVNGTV